LSPEHQPRRTLRFPLQTAVKFWWTDKNGKKNQGEGRSRDLSEHGAFIFSHFCPPLGAGVSLEIALVGVPNEIGPLPVELKGEVLRVEQPPTETGLGGFAIAY